MKTKPALLILVLIGLLASMVFIFALPNMRTEAQTEEELIDFMLMQIYQDAATNREELIVYAEKVNESQESISMIDTTKPLRVWVYKDGEISEQIDIQNTIQSYWKELSSVTPMHSITYFTILSTSRGATTAQLAVDFTCGETCGQGVIFTVERNWSGDWKIIDSEIVWVS